MIDLIPAEDWSLVLPGEPPRRCSQSHCGSMAAVWKAKPDKRGRLRIWAYCDRCAELRRLYVREGRVMKRPAVWCDRVLAVT